MSEYKQGCSYHVRVRMTGRWAVAFYGRDIYDNVGWYLPGSETLYFDEAFSEIGPRIPTPDEAWQCVPVDPSERMMEAETKRFHVPYQECMRDVYQAMLAAAPKPGDL